MMFHIDYFNSEGIDAILIFDILYQLMSPSFDFPFCLSVRP